MVHHSIAVVITSFLTNFSERRTCEVSSVGVLALVAMGTPWASSF
jgi:hypothetical protein